MGARLRLNERFRVVRVDLESSALGQGLALQYPDGSFVDLRGAGGEDGAVILAMPSGLPAVSWFSEPSDPESRYPNAVANLILDGGFFKTFYAWRAIGNPPSGHEAEHYARAAEVLRSPFFSYQIGGRAWDNFSTLADLNAKLAAYEIAPISESDLRVGIQWYQSRDENSFIDNVAQAVSIAALAVGAGLAASVAVADAVAAGATSSAVAAEGAATIPATVAAASDLAALDAATVTAVPYVATAPVEAVALDEAAVAATAASSAAATATVATAATAATASPALDALGKAITAGAGSAIASSLAPKQNPTMAAAAPDQAPRWIGVAAFALFALLGH